MAGKSCGFLFTLRIKAVRAVISYNENICDTKTKSVRSALHCATERIDA